MNFTKYEDAYKAVVSMNNVPFENKVLQVSFKENRPPSGGHPIATSPVASNAMISVKT